MKTLATWLIILLGIASFAYIGNMYLINPDESMEDATEVEGEMEESDDVDEVAKGQSESESQVGDESESTDWVAPPKTTPKVAAPAPTPKPDMDADGYYIVRYTNAGFEPFIREIKVRDTIRFINESDRPMWVTASYHPYVPDQEYTYPEFKQPKSVYKGGEFIFTFIRGGTWGYKNLNNEEHLGAVVVLE